MKTAIYPSLSVLVVLLAFASLLWANGDKHKDKKMEKKSGHWAAPSQEKARINPFAATKESISRGKALYQKECMGCHGVNGYGNGPDAPYITPKPSNLKAMAGHHSDGASTSALLPMEINFENPNPLSAA